MSKAKYWDGSQWVEIGQDHGQLSGLADGTCDNFAASSHSHSEPTFGSFVDFNYTGTQQIWMVPAGVT